MRHVMDKTRISQAGCVLCSPQADRYNRHGLICPACAFVLKGAPLDSREQLARMMFNSKKAGDNPRAVAIRALLRGTAPAGAGQGAIQNLLAQAA